MSIVREVKVLDRTITLELQKYAKQTNATVMVSCGDTQVLVTVCAADETKEGQGREWKCKEREACYMWC